jgi:hypothetical protein
MLSNLIDLKTISDEDMHTNYMVKDQSMIECQAQDELKPNLFVSLIRTTRVGLTKKDA